MLQDIPPLTLREAGRCVLETERLMLRRPTLADVKAIAHLANDRRIAENTRRLPHPYLQDHAVEFVRGIATERRETVFLIESNHTPIGMVGIDWREPEMPELGYWLGVEYWGQGFATEAAGAVLAWAFDTLDLNRVQAETDTRNTASSRVLERLRFVREGTLREDCIVEGEVSDSWVYGLLRREWAPLRSRSAAG